MTPIHVSCAIIEKNGLILAVRRSPEGCMPGKWEFPGGKIEAGEDAESCIVREIREELGTEVRIVRRLDPVEHRYPDFGIVLHPFVCEGSPPVLREHDALLWDRAENLRGLDWAEADIGVLKEYLESKETRHDR